jgi:hypothetical protein
MTTTHSYRVYDSNGTRVYRPQHLTPAKANEVRALFQPYGWTLLTHAGPPRTQPPLLYRPRHARPPTQHELLYD